MRGFSSILSAMWNCICTVESECTRPRPPSGDRLALKLPLPPAPAARNGGNHSQLQVFKVDSIPFEEPLEAPAHPQTSIWLRSCWIQLAPEAVVQASNCHTAIAARNDNVPGMLENITGMDVARRGLLVAWDN